MEKLIELLNEYKEEKNICNTDMDWQLEIWNYRYVNYPCAERLCSKKYWFIKWLVDNDKINFNLVERVWSWDFIYDMNGNPYYHSCTCEDLEEYDEVDRVIMLLAIQDEPIEFLIFILK